jgi:branched-chain amino acid transport system permease protein
VSLGAWSELIASGLITGGIYALIALGPEPAVRADARAEHRAWRIPDAGRLHHLGGAHGLGLSPLLMIPVSFALLMAWAW